MTTIVCCGITFENEITINFVEDVPTKMLFKRIIAGLAIIITAFSLFSCAPPDTKPGNGVAIVYPSDMTATTSGRTTETTDTTGTTESTGESTATDEALSAEDTTTNAGTVEAATRSTAAVTTRAPKPAPETTVRNTNVVYVTPSGKRYHYISTCGGKNSYEVSLDNIGGRTPCQKCVH